MNILKKIKKGSRCNTLVPGFLAAAMRYKGDYQNPERECIIRMDSLYGSLLG